MRNLVITICLSVALSACAGNNSNLSDDILTNKGDGTILSEKFQLQWQQKKSKRFTNAENAHVYVDELNLAGHSDWRIPTKAESHNLFFSMDFGKSNAKDMQMKMDGSMWVILDDGTLQAGAWDAGETCCIVRTFKKDSKGGVRAVRP